MSVDQVSVNWTSYCNIEIRKERVIYDETGNFHSFQDFYEQNYAHPIENEVRGT